MSTSSKGIVGKVCAYGILPALVLGWGVALAEGPAPSADTASYATVAETLMKEDAAAPQGVPALPDEPVLSEVPEAPLDIAALKAEHAGGPGLHSVIVTTGVSQKPGRTDRPDLAAFAARQGGILKYSYDAALPGVYNLRGLTDAAVEELRKMPGVVSVEEDQYYPDLLRLHKSTPLIRGLQSQITGAGLSANGSGIRVCVVDTGIDSDHLMYSSRIDTAAGRDFYNDDNNPEDDNGHGSHVSGIAVGGTGLNVDFGCVGPQPFQGVAPAATLIGIKVLNSSGGGFDSDIIAGINYGADQTANGGRCDVMNMSIGIGQYSGPCTHSWAVAANNAVANGVVVVAASGNENYANALSSPACGVNVIAVGATYNDDYPNCEISTSTFSWGVCTDIRPVEDQIVCFSNESDYLDVAAPGSIIYSASNAAGGGSIVGQSGTSMASPHVAGLAALILDADPTLTPAEVRQIIRDGAIDKGTPGFDRAYGYGRIDVINSLNLVGGVGCTTNPECDDGLWCNGAETCVGGTCQSGTAPNCNDGVACTTDSCNESTDSCNHVPSNAACDDGLFCNGAETCNVTLGCQAGTDPCAGGPCDENNNLCQQPSNEQLWVVFTTAATVPGLGTVQNEDIVAYDVGAGTWSWVFDGSDVGLGSFAINGMTKLADGSLLLTFTAAGTVGGVAMDDSDIVRFVPTSLGATTAGSFSMYFDGSDVGLTVNDEDIDAIGIAADGRLFISVIGNFSANGASGVDEDLFVFNATSLGSNTAGTFALYFDGSDVGLSNSSSEDVDAAELTSSGTLLLSTVGSFSVTGLTGTGLDVIEFTPGSLGSTTSGTYSLYLSLASLGISTSENIAALHLEE